jgi:hypothetical protein
MSRSCVQAVCVRMAMSGSVFARVPAVRCVLPACAHVCPSRASVRLKPSRPNLISSRAVGLSTDPWWHCGPLQQRYFDCAAAVTAAQCCVACAEGCALLGHTGGNGSLRAAGLVFCGAAPCKAIALGLHDTV